ncbi:MAG TPA: hypothetical protein VGY66_19745, partial [Gemmataceae bacterium]|nr:hypothetical protein [Gemmataceae bacterium]
MTEHGILSSGTFGPTAAEAAAAKVSAGPSRNIDEVDAGSVPLAGASNFSHKAGRCFTACLAAQISPCLYGMKKARPRFARHEMAIHSADLFVTNVDEF